MKRKIRMIKGPCILFFLTLITFSAFSQGSGADGAVTISSAGTVIDGTRSQLNGSASAGQAVVTVENSAGFANNQVCLLIQMRGTGAGNYEEKTISSISGNNITFSSNLIYTYTDDGTAANANNMAQLIKMPQYTNVTINAGSSLTCTAWNGTTGGVVCFLANGTLTINSTAGGGIFATAKGGVAGSGGTGGSADGDSDGGAPGGFCANGGDADGDGGGNNGCGGAGGFSGGKSAGTAGTTGSAGGTAIIYNSTAGATISSGTSASNNSNNAFWGSGQGQFLLIGGGGAGGAGGNSGKSGGGGGGSGDCTQGGAHGSKADGGNGGAGGNGGGVIYFRCNVLTGAGDIVSSGAAGTAGSGGYNACAGRAPGDGGDGGSGVNGNGGTGGGSGAPGAIFVLKASTTFSGAITAAAGTAGAAGTQGAAGPKGNMVDCGDFPCPGPATAGSNGSSGATANSSAINTTNETLPVKYLTFYGVNNDSYNKIFWVTASETNSDYFEIQRSSDGLEFSSIDKVSASGNSSTTLNYHCTDHEPYSSITYYRLKQVDMDGKYEYSTIISILKGDCANLPEILLRPNPASEQIEITFGSKKQESVMLKIFDSDSKLIWTETYIVYKGINSIPVNLISFPYGNYIVSIEDKNGNRTRTGKFIKK